DVKAAARVALDVRDALSVDRDHCARLCSRRNFRCDGRSVREHDGDFRSERGLWERELGFGRQVVAVALELFVGFHGYIDVEITRFRPGRTGHPLTWNSQSLSVVDAWRKRDDDLASSLRRARTAALGARVRYDLAAPAAARARRAEHDEAALRAHLSGAA